MDDGSIQPSVAPPIEATPRTSAILSGRSWAGAYPRSGSLCATFADPADAVFFAFAVEALPILARVHEEARRLRDSGYDGSFMGDPVASLFRSLAEADRIQTIRDRVLSGIGGAGGLHHLQRSG